MIIKKSAYVASAVKESQYPQAGWPEIALAGRSNVGKSSLINCLLQRKNLARTSSAPGKTQTLNFYSVNDEFYLVDVPGYGYAKVSRQKRQEFGVMIQDYLETRAELCGLMILVDGRHAPSKDDCAMYEYAQYLKLPIMVVLTKMDKVKKSQYNKSIKLLKQSFALDKPGVEFMTFSAQTKLHRAELLAWLEKTMQNA